VANKALAIITALPLIMQLAGCASSVGARGVSSVTKSVPELTPPTPATTATTATMGTPATPATPAGSEAAQDAKTFGEAVERGDKAWQANELDRAVYYYVLALERSPHDAPTLAKIGAIEEGRGNTALAQKAFEMAHAAQPDEPRIAERLAQLYMQQAKVESAAQIYAQVLALHPQRARALDGMGAVCIMRADYVQSIHYFDQALQADNADAASVLTHRGYAKLRVNDLPAAEADLRAALAVAPQPDTWRYLADLQVRRRDTAGALESLLKIMDSAHAYNEIGVVLLNMNNYRDSKLYFAKAISASPTWYEEAQRNLDVAEERLQGAADKATASR
jgi:Tfp pilus assembly protein PilF